MIDLISVIVPIYNTGLPLKRCVDSIISQTYSPIEIILVDDGSTDDTTLEICSEYEKKYSDITVVHQTNGGPSKARNTGIQVAHGRYIAFVDSDDIIDPDAYQRLHDAAVKYDVPIVLGSMRIHGAKQHFASSGLTDGRYPQNIVLSKFMQGYWHSACTNLYCKELIKDIVFPLNEINEDYIFNFNVLLGCDSIAILNKPFYHYVRQENSRTSSPASMKHLDWLKHTEYVEEQISGLFDKQLIDEAKFQLLYSYIVLANKCIISMSRGIKEEPCEVYTITTSKLENIRLDILSNKYLSVHYKIYGILMSTIPVFYKNSILSLLRVKRWLH